MSIKIILQRAEALVYHLSLASLNSLVKLPCASGDSGWEASSMMTRNDAVAMQQFCVMMTFSDALPVLSTKNDGHCHHSCMGVFPDPQ